MKQCMVRENTNGTCTILAFVSILQSLIFILTLILVSRPLVSLQEMCQYFKKTKSLHDSVVKDKKDEEKREGSSKEEKKKRRGKEERIEKRKE